MNRRSKKLEELLFSAYRDGGFPPPSPNPYRGAACTLIRGGNCAPTYSLSPFSGDFSFLRKARLLEHVSSVQVDMRGRASFFKLARICGRDSRDFASLQAFLEPETRDNRSRSDMRNVSRLGISQSKTNDFS